eukprot:2774433-Rhodomonas_salina.2
MKQMEERMASVSVSYPPTPPIRARRLRRRYGAPGTDLAYGGLLVPGQVGARYQGVAAERGTIVCYGLRWSAMVCVRVVFRSDRLSLFVSLSLPPALPLSLSPSLATSPLSLSPTPSPSLPLSLSPSLPLSLTISASLAPQAWEQKVEAIQKHTDTRQEQLQKLGMVPRSATRLLSPVRYDPRQRRATCYAPPTPSPVWDYADRGGSGARWLRSACEG